MIKGGTFDVIVIGGGISGLTTAYRLAQKGKTVLVLEADEKFGGRTKSIKLEDPDKKGADINVSWGGTWSMIDDVLTLGLAKAVNSPLFKPEATTDQTTVLQLLSIAAHPWLLFELWVIGAIIYNDNPYDYWRHPQASYYDNIDLSKWLEQKRSLWKQVVSWLHDKIHKTNSKTAVKDWFLLLENQPPELEEISTLWAAMMVYLRLSHWTRGGLFPPRILRWQGGTQTFITKLVIAIEAFRDCKCKTNATVTKIVQDKDFATVFAGDTTYRAKYVAVATSITSASSRIVYEPKLPSGVAELNEGLGTWDDPAVNLIYVFKKEAGWKQGYSYLPNVRNDPGIQSGQVWGPVMELSEKAQDPDGGYGVLRILVDDRRTRSMSSSQIAAAGLEYLIKTVLVNVPEMRRIVQNHKTTLRSPPVVLNWRNYVDSIPGVTYFWRIGYLTKDAHSRDNTGVSFGGVAGANARGPSDGIKKNGDYIKAIFGRVHFGGAERSARGLHWIEGAVRRGAEVAGEILAAMREPGFNLKEYMLRLEEDGTKAAEAYSGIFSRWQNNPDVEENRSELLKNFDIPEVRGDRTTGIKLNTLSTAAAHQYVDWDRDEALPDEEHNEEDMWNKLRDHKMSVEELRQFVRRAYVKRERRIAHEKLTHPECAEFVPFTGHPPTLQLFKAGTPTVENSTFYNSNLNNNINSINLNSRNNSTNLNSLSNSVGVSTFNNANSNNTMNLNNSSTFNNANSNNSVNVSTFNNANSNDTVLRIQHVYKVPSVDK